MKTFYYNLRISEMASLQEIEKARECLLEIHKLNKYPAEFWPRQQKIHAAINEAHRVLSNPRLRAQYDQWLKKQGAYNAKAKATAVKEKMYSQEEIDFDFPEIKWSPYSWVTTLGVVVAVIAISGVSKVIGLGIIEYGLMGQKNDTINEPMKDIHRYEPREMGEEEKNFEKEFNTYLTKPIRVDEITTVTEAKAVGYKTFFHLELDKNITPNKGVIRKTIINNFKANGKCDILKMYGDRPVVFNYDYSMPNGNRFTISLPLKEACDWE